MRFACFRFCYLRKIPLQPIDNCLPEHFSQIIIAYRFNNRTAKFEILFRRKDAQIRARAKTPDRLRNDRPALFKSNAIQIFGPSLLRRSCL
jgi:hypothetical protein